MTAAGDIESLRRVYEIWNDGDVATIAERYWSPQVEWHDPPELAKQGIHVGSERVIARIVELAGQLGLPRIRVARITELGGEYIIELDVDLPPAAVDQPPGTVAPVHVVRFVDGRITRLRTFVDAESAFATVSGEVQAAARA